MSTINFEKRKNELMNRGKTRIESLKERIDVAFETLRNIYDESKLEKISQKKVQQKKIFRFKNNSI